METSQPGWPKSWAGSVFTDVIKKLSFVTLNSNAEMSGKPGQTKVRRLMESGPIS